MMPNSIRFIKMCARCIALLLLLGVPDMYAQQPTAYFDFKATGVSGSQIKTISNGNTVKVLITGGYVNILAKDTFKKSKGLNFRAYYKDKQPEKAADTSLKDLIYLYPDNAYFIEVYEQATNKLVIKYTIQRPKLFPKIGFYRQNNQLFYTTKMDGEDEAFSLSPNEKIKLEIAQPTGFKEMEVEYSLRNLKTKETQYGISKYGFKDLEFAANTDYELRFNYVVQKESLTTLYIHVKPYWYQSVATYIGVLIVLVALGILLLTLTLKKKIRFSQREQQKLEQAAIRLQSLLNPHFTFNALSTIQGLMNTGRIDEANQYLQEFSALLRQTLAKSQQVYTTLDQELEMMRLYIKLEAFRFKFAWEIEVSKELNPSELEIPTLLLQPLIENAIKHGLSKSGDQGKLQIICTAGQKKNTFVILIKDNGSWVNKADLGYGLSLTAERIATINKMKKDQHIILDFDKLAGTTAILTFHNWIDN